MFFSCVLPSLAVQHPVVVFFHFRFGLTTERPSSFDSNLFVAVAWQGWVAFGLLAFPSCLTWAVMDRWGAIGPLEVRQGVRPCPVALKGYLVDDLLFRSVLEAFLGRETPRWFECWSSGRAAGIASIGLVGFNQKQCKMAAAQLQLHHSVVSNFLYNNLSIIRNFVCLVYSAVQKPSLFLRMTRMTMVC